MKRGSLVAPLVLIAVLGGVIGVQRLSPLAAAQATNRARGEYTVVSGRQSSGGPHILYVVDSSNNEMIALRWDQSRQMLAGTGYRNLAADSNMQIGR
jgi:hypothetical protein